MDRHMDNPLFLRLSRIFEATGLSLPERSSRNRIAPASSFLK
jgi:hypothetical protein